MQDFRKLQAWAKAHALTLHVYDYTQGFLEEALYGLTSQIRRACVSIAANITEGCGRGGRAEFARFLQISIGSASELEYHLLLAHDLHYMEAATYQSLNSDLVEVKSMLHGLIKVVRNT